MHAPVKITSSLPNAGNGAPAKFFSAGKINAFYPHGSGQCSKSGVIQRLCRGIYLNPRVSHPGGLVLFHAAGKLRADFFNYVSLETVLSEAGVISQIPLDWITLMSSGRSSIINCRQFGTIEFVHTKKRPGDLAGRLIYDTRYRLWKACVELAVSDLRATGRSADLIDWSAVHAPGKRASVPHPAKEK
jgi:hypothetical protein